jgi:hypothetical protein
MVEPSRTTWQAAPPASGDSYIQLSNGSWVPHQVNPVYVAANHSDPSADHMYLNVTLSFPHRPPIKLLAFLDCGAQTSLIGEHLVSRHNLPRHLLDTPLSLRTFDGRPSTSGTVTQGVLTHLRIKSVNSHSEFKSFGIARMPYDIMLGLDWLRRHNPAIDWSSETLTFSCCNSGPRPKDASASLPTESSDDPSIDHIDSESGSSDNLPAQPKPAPERGPGKVSLDSSDSPPEIKTIDFASFLSIEDIVACGLFRPSDTVAISASSSGTPASLLPVLAAPGNSLDPVSSPSLTEIKSLLPEKWHPYAELFRNKEVEVLAPHRPEHDIKLELEEGKSPPFGPIYSLSRIEREALRTYIDDSLRRGFIRPSTSSAASPILFAKKSNGSLRLCVDYRGLNAITKPNRYPLPLVNDLLDSIRGSTVFSKLDLKSAFNLLRVTKGDEWKTAFRTNEGLYEYLVMPFGLKNAPSAWQSFIQWVLRAQLDISCVVYLDDILIFSHTQAKHDRDVAGVLNALREHGLYCNIEKCEFDVSEVEYLGFLVGTSGV